jgi:hypothetical protein
VPGVPDLNRVPQAVAVAVHEQRVGAPVDLLRVGEGVTIRVAVVRVGLAGRHVPYPVAVGVFFGVAQAVAIAVGKQRIGLAGRPVPTAVGVAVLLAIGQAVTVCIDSVWVAASTAGPVDSEIGEPAGRLADLDKIT